MKCSMCYGFGYTFNSLDISNDCELCAGTGEAEAPWKLYGEDMKMWRLEQDLTLREAAEEYNVDFSNLSKMERGLIKPRCYWKTISS